MGLLQWIKEDSTFHNVEHEKIPATDFTRFGLFTSCMEDSLLNVLRSQQAATA